MNRPFTLSLRSIFTILTVVVTLVLAYASNLWQIQLLKEQVTDIRQRIDRLEQRR